MATKIITSSVSVWTSAVQLTADTNVFNTEFYVKAATANTANVYVWPSTVTANTTAATDGYELAPWEVLPVTIDNVSQVYARSTAASQKVFLLNAI